MAEARTRSVYTPDDSGWIEYQVVKLRFVRVFLQV